MEKVEKVGGAVNVKNNYDPKRNFNCRKVHKSKEDEEYEAYFCEMLKRKRKLYER